MSPSNDSNITFAQSSQEWLSQKLRTNKNNYNFCVKNWEKISDNDYRNIKLYFIVKELLTHSKFKINQSSFYGRTYLKSRKAMLLRIFFLFSKWEISYCNFWWIFHVYTDILLHKISFCTEREREEFEFLALLKV